MLSTASAVHQDFIASLRGRDIKVILQGTHLLTALSHPFLFSPLRLFPFSPFPLFRHQ